MHLKIARKDQDFFSSRIRHAELRKHAITMSTIRDIRARHDFSLVSFQDILRC